MLDICYRKGEAIDIIFNARKSSLFVVGKACNKKLEQESRAAARKPRDAASILFG